MWNNNTIRIQKPPAFNAQRWLIGFTIELWELALVVFVSVITNRERILFVPILKELFNQKKLSFSLIIEKGNLITIPCYHFLCAFSDTEQRLRTLLRSFLIAFTSCVRVLRKEKWFFHLFYFKNNHFNGSSGILQLLAPFWLFTIGLI